MLGGYDDFYLSQKPENILLLLDSSKKDILTLTAVNFVKKVFTKCQGKLHLTVIKTVIRDI